MKRLMHVLAMVAALAVALAPVAAFAYQQYATPVSATQANTAVAFGFKATTVLIINDGSNEVWIDWKDTTAVASTDFEVKSGESITLTWDPRYDPNTDGFAGVGVICSTGETATVRVLATR